MNKISLSLAVVFLFSGLTLSTTALAGQCVNGGSGDTGGVSGMTVSQLRGFNGMTDQNGCEDDVTVAVIMSGGPSDLLGHLKTYSAAFGLPAPTKDNFRILAPDGSCAPQGDPIEANIDVQMVHAMAPNAKIILSCFSGPTIQAKSRAILGAIRNGARIISMSWGRPENQADIDVLEAIFKNHPNVTFIAGSGDSGANVTADGVPQIAYPASSPNVLAVGAAARTTDGVLKAWTKSGGGVANLTPRPSYQANIGIPGTGRAIPDLSSSGSSDAPVLVVGDAGWVPTIGTSIASPLVAGMMAVVLQKRGRTIGNVAPFIYSQEATAIQSLLFRDVQVGQNQRYKATPGYDLMTGVGALNMDNLVRFLANRP